MPQDPNNPQAEIMHASIRMLNSMTENFALNNAVSRIPVFDGKSIELKNFLQDLRNAQIFIEPAQQRAFVTAVLGRLTGAARDCCYGRTFQNTTELISHLKKRFAPGRDYNYYVNKLNLVRMNQGESVSDYYDRLRILMSAAESSLKENMNRDEIQNNLPLMMEPLKKQCRDIFIRGLMPSIATTVDITQPETLEQAYNNAVRTETRMESRIIPDTRPRLPRNMDNRPYTNQYRQQESPYVGMIDHFSHRPPPNWPPYEQQYRSQNGYNGPYPGMYPTPPWNYPRRNPFYPNQPLNSYGARQNPGASPYPPRIPESMPSENKAIQNTTMENKAPTTNTTSSDTQNTPSTRDIPSMPTTPHTTNMMPNTTQDNLNNGRAPYRPQFRPPLFNPYQNQNYPPRMFRNPMNQNQDPNPNPYSNYRSYQNYQNRNPYAPWKSEYNNQHSQFPNPNAQAQRNPVLSINPHQENQETRSQWEQSPHQMEDLLPDPSLDFQDWEPMLREMMDW